MILQGLQALLFEAIAGLLGGRAIMGSYFAKGAAPFLSSPSSSPPNDADNEAACKVPPT
jgi:hypothetical protein